MSQKEITITDVITSIKEKGAAHLVDIQTRERTEREAIETEAKMKEREQIKLIQESERLLRATGVVNIFEQLRDSKAVIYSTAPSSELVETSFLGFFPRKEWRETRPYTPAKIEFHPNKDDFSYLYTNKKGHVSLEFDLTPNGKTDSDGWSLSSPHEISAYLSDDGSKIDYIYWSREDYRKGTGVIKVEDNLLEAVEEAVLQCKGLK